MSKQRKVLVHGLPRYVLAPALAVLCLLAPLPRPAEANTQRQLEQQARQLDLFMAQVRALRALDLSSSSSVSRYLAELDRRGGRALAEGYVARLVLTGAANRQLRGGVEAEISRLGAREFFARLRSNRSYASQIPGAQAAIADMKRQASNLAREQRQTAEAKERSSVELEEAKRGADRAESAASVVVVLSVVITIVVVIVAIVVVTGSAGDAAADAGEAAADAAEDAANEVGETIEEVVDTVLTCEQKAAAKKQVCLDEAGSNQWAQAACGTAYLSDIATCTAGSAGS